MTWARNTVKPMAKGAMWLTRGVALSSMQVPNTTYVRIAVPNTSMRITCNGDDSDGIRKTLQICVSHR